LIRAITHSRHASVLSNNLTSKIHQVLLRQPRRTPRSEQIAHGARSSSDGVALRQDGARVGADLSRSLPRPPLRSAAYSTARKSLRTLRPHMSMKSGSTRHPGRQRTCSPPPWQWMLRPSDTRSASAGVGTCTGMCMTSDPAGGIQISQGCPIIPHPLQACSVGTRAALLRPQALSRYHAEQVKTRPHSNDRARRRKALAATNTTRSLPAIARRLLATEPSLGLWTHRAPLQGHSRFCPATSSCVYKAKNPWRPNYRRRMPAIRRLVAQPAPADLVLESIPCPARFVIPFLAPDTRQIA